MKKKWLAGILSAVMVFSVTGCGGGGGDTAASSAGCWCSAGCGVFWCGRCAGWWCWGLVLVWWCVVLAGDLLPGAAGGGRPAGWWGGVNSGEKKSPCRR